MDLLTRRVIFISEAARLEAIVSERPIIPEPIGLYDEQFVEQFYQTIERVCADGYETTPEIEHNSWLRAHEQMGWKYGSVRDVNLKTHPDIVPFDKLEPKKKERDAVFLALCDFARKFIR